MIRDPFYQQIIERLEGQLDPELFERCAADLLRDGYPTLVPIRGGQDAGMDGAIADGEGRPFPLVSTTGKDVIGNLTRNLESYRKHGGTRRKIVLATSQKLSQKRRNNLYDRADQLGFILLQVFDQAAMATLLYRSPEWCLELLNLSSNTAPLSVVPRTARPLLSQPMIGREADLLWLRALTNDGLLVGQPGLGKTFLLYQLAMEGKGLYVISDDRREIAAAIRAQQPGVVMVDDAQIYGDLLLNLKQLREETGAEFAILASCWPGARDEIIEILNLSEARVHKLSLLTRDEIVQVIEDTGLHDPIGLLREIVNQAEGRPGLAVSLAHLCLQGSMQEIALGDALSRSIMHFYRPLIGPRASPILAAFSVGGDSGMKTEVVASALGLSLVEVWEAVNKLASGGVILEIDQRRLAVRPPALRHALVRDTFFGGANSLQVEPLLMQCPDMSEAALTLIGAAARGATVPKELLIGVLERADSARAWTQFAWLGREEARWILEHYPKKTVTAQPVLYRAPDAAIPVLLEASIGDQRPLHSTIEHPLRLIEDWVHAAPPKTGQGFERRKILFESIRDWLLAGGDSNVGIRAFQSVLSPQFRYVTTDPGMGNTGTIHYGYPSLDELIAIQGLWTNVREVIRKVEIAQWEPIRRIVEAWAYPGRVNTHIPSQMYDTMRSLAGQMLRDIVSIGHQRFGIVHWAKQIAEQLDVDFEIPLDPDFEVLYPKEDLENWRKVEKKQGYIVRRLADAWSACDPVPIARKISRIEKEAQLADIRWPRWTPFLCMRIAEQTESPSEWAQAMVEANATSDLLLPFLRKAAKQQELDWVELAANFLHKPTHKAAAISLILTLSAPPEHLLADVLKELDGFSQFVESLCLRNEIPENTVGKLLRHEDTAIASAAAWGEWYADPERSVRDTLYQDWRHVVVNIAEKGHWLCEILKEDSSLAYDWLQAYVVKQRWQSLGYQTKDPVEVAVSALDVDERRVILLQLADIQPDYGAAELVACLVDDNIELYQELLSDERLKQFHLVTLSGYPEGIWTEKAKLAIDAGYSFEAVVHAAWSPVSMFVESGKESIKWTSWAERFEALCSSEDVLIQKLSKVGMSMAIAHRERALEWERTEAIYGIG